MNTWVTSDWHFNHSNIIKYCNRPFKSVSEMNEYIVSEYNRLVQPGDIVYVLGDIGMGNLDEIIPRLRGNKILISGNHDKLSVSRYVSIGFSAVLASADVQVGRTFVHLRHIPTMSVWRKWKLYLSYIRDMRGKGRSWKVIWQSWQPLSMNS